MLFREETLRVLISVYSLCILIILSGPEYSWNLKIFFLISLKRVEKGKFLSNKPEWWLKWILCWDEMKSETGNLRIYLINLKIAFMLIAIQTRFHSSFYPSTILLSVVIIKIPAWPCLLRLVWVWQLATPHPPIHRFFPNTLKSRFCLLIKRIARADDFVFNFQITIIVVTITDAVQCRGWAAMWWICRSDVP